MPSYNMPGLGGYDQSMQGAAVRVGGAAPVVVRPVVPVAQPVVQQQSAPAIVVPQPALSPAAQRILADPAGYRRLLHEEAVRQQQIRQAQQRATLAPPAKQLPAAPVAQTPGAPQPVAQHPVQTPGPQQPVPEAQQPVQQQAVPVVQQPIQQQPVTVVQQPVQQSIPYTEEDLQQYTGIGAAVQGMQRDLQRITRRGYNYWKPASQFAEEERLEAEAKRRAEEASFLTYMLSPIYNRRGYKYW